MFSVSTPVAAGTIVQEPVCSADVSRLQLLVVGQGYVGLPLSLRAAEAGHRVVGLDTDIRRTEAARCRWQPI